MNGYADIIGLERRAGPRMNRADRAKLFAPFAALRGFEESVHAREARSVPRPEPAPDRAEQVDRRLRKLKPGDRVTVTYFCPLTVENAVEMGEIQCATGNFVALSHCDGTLTLTCARLALRDILDIGAR